MNFALPGVVTRQHWSLASLGMQASEFRERGAENQPFFFVCLGFCQTLWADISKTQTCNFLTILAVGRVKFGVGLECRTTVSKFSLGVWEELTCCECPQKPSPELGLQTINNQTLQLYPNCKHHTQPSPYASQPHGHQITHISLASLFSTGKFLHISFPSIIF